MATAFIAAFTARFYDAECRNVENNTKFIDHAKSNPSDAISTHCERVCRSDYVLRLYVHVRSAYIRQIGEAFQTERQAIDAAIAELQRVFTLEATSGHSTCGAANAVAHAHVLAVNDVIQELQSILPLALTAS